MVTDIMIPHNHDIRHVCCLHDALYLALQGAGRLGWPLLASAIRLRIGIGWGWLALTLGASLNWLFVALALALVVYGIVVAVAIASGAWYADARDCSGRAALALSPA
jgi:hypothetical protein